MAFLKVYSNDEERTVFLGESPVVFGRDEACDVHVKDVKVSREHCVIEPCGDGTWRVLDLRSGNGTKVNGERIEGGRVLRPDDVISLGDAKVLFAGEGAAVAAAPARAPAAGPQAPAPAAGGEPARRAPRRTTSAKARYVVGGVAFVGLLVLFVLWRSAGDGPKGPTAEEQDYAAVRNAASPSEQARLAEVFLAQYPGSRFAGAVRDLETRARDRLRAGPPPESGFDPLAGRPEGAGTLETVQWLEKRRDEASEERRAGYERALEEWRGRLQEERESLFSQLEAEVRALAAQGQYARAREIWFFLRGDPNWEPVPQEYLRRIIAGNEELENAAAADRSKLLEEEARLEAMHDFERARRMLLDAMPRFKGTSVERSLEERLVLVERALKSGAKVPAGVPPTVVRLDLEKKLKALLAALPARDFRAAADGLAALAAEAEKAADPGAPVVAARARECAAAAGLHDAMVERLAAGKVPSGQIAKRWRVVAGDAATVRVSSKGEEQTLPWAEAPAELYLALLERTAPEAANGWLGLAVAAHGAADEPALLAALARGYEVEGARGPLDAFVGGVLKGEAVPEGGYVVAGAEILSRKEYLRREEEALIVKLQTQLDEAYAAVKADKTFAKLEKLRESKDELDKTREFALALIFDEKTYFYPYRGTGREGEYNKVQQEVDRRVAAVRELWDKDKPVSVKATPELTKALARFDEAARELDQRLVDVEEKRAEMGFLRSYLDKKFTVRTFYRSPEERELLEYSDEVMAFNPGVTGDIAAVEREQVRITNEYRMMFGRWPLRLVDKLVLSSRGHCEEMSRLGYFGHFSPTPGRKTPYDRMRLQGYEYGSSENCIMGRTGPQAAHDGWCHSSGHHRNILMPPWTEMGTGHSGIYMTQNYGQAPKWSEKQPRDTTLREWEDPGDGGDEAGPPGGFDYGDD